MSPLRGESSYRGRDILVARGRNISDMGEAAIAPSDSAGRRWGSAVVPVPLQVGGGREAVKGVR